MKIIKLTESQFKKLIETQLPSFEDGGDMIEYLGPGYVGVGGLGVPDEDGEGLGRSKPEDADKLQDVETSQSCLRNNRV